MSKIEFKGLVLPEYNKYKENMNLFDKMVFEELYRYYYGQQAPYDYYHADNVISPNDTKNHREYFPKVKPLVVELAELWHPELRIYLAENDREVKNLNMIVDNIEHSQDMVDLMWYATQLKLAVNALYSKYELLVGEGGMRAWRYKESA